MEVEAVLPSHLEGRRREADGWVHELSLAKGAPGREARDRVAIEFGVDAGALESALRYAEAVEVIARNCGHDALSLMLKADSRLKASEVLKIGRKGPERQRYEVDLATNHAQLHTKGHYGMKRPGAGDWPMDTRDFA